MYNIVPFFINFCVIWVVMSFIGSAMNFFIQKKLRVNDILFNLILGFGAPIYQLSMVFLNEEKQNKINSLGEIVVLKFNNGNSS